MASPRTTHEVPRTRLQLGRSRRLRLLLALTVGAAAGAATFTALHYATRPEPKWVVTFPADDSKRWKTFNTQKPYQQKPASIAKHHAKWFVVPRDPRGTSTRQTEWYSIDGEERRIVGPWKPEARFEQHGFHPAGCYVGIEHAADDEDIVRVHIYDPVRSVGRILSIPRPRDTRLDYEQIQLSSDCSTVSVSGVGTTEPLSVRIFDVSSGEKRHELIFPKEVGPAGFVFYMLFDRGQPAPDTVICSLSSTGRFLAVGSASTGIDIIDLSSQQEPVSIDSVPTSRGSILISQKASPILVAFDSSDHTATITLDIRGSICGVFADLETGDLNAIPSRKLTDLGLIPRRGVVYSIDGKTSLQPDAGWDQHSFPVIRHRPLSRLRSSDQKMEADWAAAESASLDANGYLVHACPVPSSDLVVANVIRTIPGRTSLLPFGRSVLDYLGLDQVQPQTYEKHFLQLDFATQKTVPIRKLKTTNPYSRTDVLVQPNRIGLLLQKTDHQVFEVWPLPRYEVAWIRPAAFAVALIVFSWLGYPAEPRTAKAPDRRSEKNTVHTNTSRRCHAVARCWYKRWMSSTVTVRTRVNPVWARSYVILLASDASACRAVATQSRSASDSSSTTPASHSVFASTTRDSSLGSNLLRPAMVLHRSDLK